MIWLLSYPLPPTPMIKLSLFLSLPVFCRSSLLAGRGGGGVGIKSFDSEKAWSSINYSILSDHKGKQRDFLFPFSSKYVFCQVAEITDILQGPNCPFLKDYASKGKPLDQCSGSVTLWTHPDPRIRTSDRRIRMRMRISINIVTFSVQ
jgi:hypothetical protein